MRLRQTLIILSLSAVPAVAFFNCQQSGPMHYSPQVQQATQPETTLPPLESPFERHKVQIDFNALTVSTLDGSTPVNGGVSAKAMAADQSALPAGTRLIAIVDNNCLLENAEIASDGDEIPLSSKIPARQPEAHIAELDRQAYAFTLDQDTGLSSLTQKAESDDCLIGITNDAEARITSVMNDPQITLQHHLQATHALAAFDTFFSSSLGIQNDVVIAIVDTGIAYNHPDLAANMWRSSTGTFGRDFYYNDEDPLDDNGHGTHVSGLAAATANNGAGGIGIMGLHGRLMAVKVMSSAGETLSLTPIINGITYAVSQGADVINLSLASKGANAGLLDAIRNAIDSGVTVAIAAGNSAVEISTTNFYVPAAYGIDLPGAITVGSIDVASGEKSSFSNYSSTYVEMVAPGSSGSTKIFSTLPGNGYGYLQGTSMSSPQVAGAAALVIGLLRSHGMDPTPAEVESILMEATPSRVSLQTYFRSGKSLDLLALANYLQSRYLFQSTGGVKEQF